MNKILPLLFFSFSLILLTACTDERLRSAIAPDWVTGESVKYPNSLYVTATGSAESPESARDRAMGNLAKVFEARIVGSSTTRSDTRTHRTGQVETVEQEQRLRQHVNVHAEKVLEGIKIAELWHDQVNGQYFALAVINREQIGNLLKTEISQLDRDTAFELMSTEKQKDSLRRVAAFQRIIRLQQSREKIQKLLKIIDLKGKGLPQKWSLTELETEFSRSLAAIKLSVSVSRDKLGSERRLELLQQLRAAMAHAGITETRTGAEFELIAEAEMQEVTRSQGWFWQRGNLQIRLVEVANGITRGSFSWQLKASATQESQLASRYSQLLEKTLKSGLRDALVGIAGAR